MGPRLRLPAAPHAIRVPCFRPSVPSCHSPSTDTRVRVASRRGGFPARRCRYEFLHWPAHAAQAVRVGERDDRVRAGRVWASDRSRVRPLCDRLGVAVDSCTITVTRLNARLSPVSTLSPPMTSQLPRTSFRSSPSYSRRFMLISATRRCQTQPSQGRAHVHTSR